MEISEKRPRKRGLGESIEICIVRLDKTSFNTSAFSMPTQAAWAEEHYNFYQLHVCCHCLLPVVIIWAQ